MSRPITDSEITLARKEGDKLIANKSTDQIKELRKLAKWNLLFLADSILGYDKVSPGLHGDLCLWLENNRKSQFRLILLPRSHYKSTIVTITDTIQTILPDDLGTATYPYNLGTNVRICIAHDTVIMAQKFLRSITQHFTLNPYLIALFPECVPNPQIQKVNLKELQLPRTAVWNESTVDTMGVGVAGQGNHYNKLKLDDIYGEAARDSQTEREAHIQWFDNIQSFLITPATDQIDTSGTRWAFDDVYAHKMKVYDKKLEKYVRSVWYKDGNGIYQPIFPEQFTIDSLEILRKNKKVWNAQYINDPKEGSAAFQPEWKRFYNRRGRDVQIFEPKTPFSDAHSEEISFHELDRLIFVDPAMGKSGDPSAIVVTGTDWKGRHFILEAVKEDLKPEQLRDKIFGLVAKWAPRAVAIEEVLFSGLFEPWFRTEMSIRGIRFKIEPVKTNQKAKEIRAAGLAHYFSASEIYFHESQEELIEEYDQFGATDDYHMLDALAYGPRLWRKGVKGRKAPPSIPIVQSDRDINTGYSKIRR